VGIANLYPGILECRALWALPRGEHKRLRNSFRCSPNSEQFQPGKTDI